MIPDETEQTIISILNLTGVFRQDADFRSLGSDSRSFPRRVSGAAAAFLDEGQQINESEQAFDSVYVKPRKLAGFTRSSSELIEDDITELGGTLVDAFSSMFRDIEDGCGWIGDGTGAYGKMKGIATQLADGNHAGGILAASGHDTCAKIDAQDLGSLIGNLPERYLDGAKWYCSSFFLGNCFHRLGASAFGYVDTPNGPRPMLQYAGFPVVATPKLPGAGDQSGKAMVAFGNLRAAAIFGSRKGLVIKSSTGRFLERDQIAFRAVERFEIVAHNIGDANNAGAVVGLLGN